MHGLGLSSDKSGKSCGRSGKELDAVGVLRDELLLLGEIVRRLIDACASVRVVVENLYDGTARISYDVRAVEMVRQEISRARRVSDTLLQILGE
jgi:hypothetical protein